MATKTATKPAEKTGTVKHRSFVSDVVLSFGPMEVVGDLLTLASTNNDEKTKMCCTDCGDVTLLSQQYVCPNDAAHGPFTPNTADRCADDGLGHFVRLSAQDVIVAKTSSLPPNQFEINVHTADDVAGRTALSGNSYVFRPKGSSKLYGVILDIIEKRPDLVLMGQVNLRKNDKLMRLVRGLNGQLILAELVWPADLKDFDKPLYEYSEKVFQQAETLIDLQTTPFDPDEYKKAAREAMAEAVAAAAGQKPAGGAKKKPAPKKDADNLEDVLAAAIASAKSKK